MMFSLQQGYTRLLRTLEMLDGGMASILRVWNKSRLRGRGLKMLGVETEWLER